MTDTRYEVAATMLRPQEFYESPEFKDRFIVLEKYMDWYAEQQGNFTYYSDWSGFNIPDNVLRQFFEVHWEYLSIKEHRLYLALAPWLERKDPFYVIATSKEGLERKGPSLLDHEMSHAFFYTLPEYKALMQGYIAEFSEGYRGAVYTKLGEMGYHPSVFEDECHAYHAADSFSKQIERFGHGAENGSDVLPTVSIAALFTTTRHQFNEQ